MTASRVRIVKVGGSLLDCDHLSKTLLEFLARQSPALHVLVCGGGTMANAIRDMDVRFRLEPEAVHWLCIDVLSITARLVAQLLPESRLTWELEEIQQAARPAVFVLDPRPFLVELEPGCPGSVLPRDWSVTSDSIAARIAEVMGADELVLLKSTGLPASSTRRSAAAAGNVDSFFPQASQPLARVRFVNLRSTPWREWELG